MDDSNKEEFEEEFEIEEEMFEEDTSFEEDFSEEEAYLDDGADLGDEEWEDEGFEEMQAEEKPKKKKKKLSSNTIIIIVAVVLGGGFMMLQLAKPKDEGVPSDLPFRSALTPAGQVNNPVTAPAQQAQRDQEQQNNQSNEGGFLSDPSMLDSIEDTVDASVDTTVDDGSLPPMPDMDMPVMPNVPNLPAPLTPMPEMASPVTSMDMAEDKIDQEIDAPQKTAAQMLQEKLAQRQEESANDPETSVVQDSAAMVDLEIKEDQKPEILDDMPDFDVVTPEIEEPMPDRVVDTAQLEQVEQLKADFAALQADIKNLRANASEKEASMNETIAMLEKKLEDEQAQNVKMSKQLSDAQAARKEPEVRTQPKEAENTPVSEPVVAVAPKTQTPKRAVARPSWELRAAMPGKAWVGKIGQQEMRSLVIGDTLSGVGTVRSITYDGQKWVVKGSQGQITQ